MAIVKHFNGATIHKPGFYGDPNQYAYRRGCIEKESAWTTMEEAEIVARAFSALGRTLRLFKFEEVHPAQKMDMGANQAFIHMRYKLRPLAFRP